MKTFHISRPTTHNPNASLLIILCLHSSVWVSVSPRMVFQLTITVGAIVQRNEHRVQKTALFPCGIRLVGGIPRFNRQVNSNQIMGGNSCRSGRCDIFTAEKRLKFINIDSGNPKFHPVICGLNFWSSCYVVQFYRMRNQYPIS